MVSVRKTISMQKDHNTKMKPVFILTSQNNFLHQL